MTDEKDNEVATCDNLIAGTWRNVITCAYLHVFAVSCRSRGVNSNTFLDNGNCFARLWKNILPVPVVTYYFQLICVNKTNHAIMHIAAHLITGSSRRDHITPVLKNLHWLPVKLCITFNILLLTNKILNGQSPSYLTSLVSSYKPVRS